MGRHPKYKTEEERAKQRRKWVTDANARRKARYADDPNYRNAVKRASRVTARKYLPAGGVSVVRAGTCCAMRGEELLSRGTMRRVTSAEVAATVLTYTTEELARCIGVTTAAISRWYSDGRFPLPRLLAKGGKGEVLVYTLEQSRALLDIMCEHYAEKNYLSHKDTEVVRRLHGVIQG